MRACIQQEGVARECACWRERRRDARKGASTSEEKVIQGGEKVAASRTDDRVTTTIKTRGTITRTCSPSEERFSLSRMLFCFAHTHTIRSHKTVVARHPSRLTSGGESRAHTQGETESQREDRGFSLSGTQGERESDGMHCALAVTTAAAAPRALF